MRVKNLGGATQNTHSSAGWLALWEKLSGQNAFICFVKGCIRRPSVGGQVQKDSSTDKNWYVIPLCVDCSKKKGQDLDIWDEAGLVSANAGEATEKPDEKLHESSRMWASRRFQERAVTSLSL
jgi:hypothetical protein